MLRPSQCTVLQWSHIPHRWDTLQSPPCRSRCHPYTIRKYDSEALNTREKVAISYKDVTIPPWSIRSRQSSIFQGSRCTWCSQRHYSFELQDHCVRPRETRLPTAVGTHIISSHHAMLLGFVMCLESKVVGSDGGGRKPFLRQWSSSAKPLGLLPGHAAWQRVRVRRHQP
jgi:hypothetical protein